MIFQSNVTNKHSIEIALTQERCLNACLKCLRVIFSEYRESEDTHEKSIFLLFHQNIPLGELIQGKIV